MSFQSFVKNYGGASAAAVLLLTLAGCSTNPSSPGAPGEGRQSSSSFASSSICAENPFLQKYQCSFGRVEEAARAGDPDAEYALGYLYYYGIGTTQDRQTGLMWIKRAAAQGQSVAKEALKNMSANNASSSSIDMRSPSTGGPSYLQSSSDASANDSVQASATAPAPKKPLTDYMPNYGQKRMDTTATPPSVNLSEPATQN